MRRPTASHVAAPAALLRAAGGMAWAATLPKNSVGSPQLKTGAVRSIDIKNGGVALVDLAPGARIPGPQGPVGPQGPTGPQGATGRTPFSALGGTAATFPDCAGGCDLATTGSGTIVARFSSKPSSTGTTWTTTGLLTLTARTPLVVRATATIAAIAAGNVVCDLTETGQVLASTGSVRFLASSGQVLTIDRRIELDEGQRDLRLLCKGSAASAQAVTSAAITFVALGT